MFLLDCEEVFPRGFRSASSPSYSRSGPTAVVVSSLTGLQPGARFRSSLGRICKTLAVRIPAIVSVFPSANSGQHANKSGYNQLHEIGHNCLLQTAETLVRILLYSDLVARCLRTLGLQFVQPLADPGHRVAPALHAAQHLVLDLDEIAGIEEAVLGKQRVGNFAGTWV